MQILIYSIHYISMTCFIEYCLKKIKLLLDRFYVLNDTIFRVTAYYIIFKKNGNTSKIK